MKKIALVLLLVLGSFGFVQGNETSSGPQGYGGVNLNLIVLGGHVGVKDIVDNFGVRFDVVTSLPISFAPIAVVGASGFYTFYENDSVAVYAGGGPKMFISGTDTNLFGISGIAGAEFIFDSFSTFIEVDVMHIPAITAIIPNTLPIIRLGFSIPF